MLFFESPREKPAQPANTLIGHVVGIAVGWAMLTVFHLDPLPPAPVGGLTGGDVLAGAPSVAGGAPGPPRFCPPPPPPRAPPPPLHPREPPPPPPPRPERAARPSPPAGRCLHPHRQPRDPHHPSPARHDGARGPSPHHRGMGPERRPRPQRRSANQATRARVTRRRRRRLCEFIGLCTSSASSSGP